MRPRHRVSWLVGFVLATAATGLPLNKITTVFGALSVGVGLGLQGIVKNLENQPPHPAQLVAQNPAQQCERAGV